MIVNEISGDLIKLANSGVFDVIIHGCNCFCSMGAGIAATVKRYYPEAYAADLQTTSGDRGKLGGYTSAISHGIKVINAYTQYDCTGDHDVDYSAVEQVFTKLNHDLPTDSKIGIPLIGAGLAGGDWNIIREIIDNATPDINITLVRYQNHF